jgi:hypothetical protein
MKSLGQGHLAQIDVAKSAYHQLSQFEIRGDNPCYQHLSQKNQRGGSLATEKSSLGSA